MFSRFDSKSGSGKNIPQAGRAAKSSSANSDAASRIAPSSSSASKHHSATTTSISKPSHGSDSLASSAAHSRYHTKTKTGCLTCKYRKKKCDETKPVCRDCRRFNKECVWADYRTMNGEEIELLKKRVCEQESTRKMRKRSSHPNDAPVGSTKRHANPPIISTTFSHFQHPSGPSAEPSSKKPKVASVPDFAQSSKPGAPFVVSSSATTLDTALPLDPSPPPGPIVSPTRTAVFSSPSKAAVSVPPQHDSGHSAAIPHPQGSPLPLVPQEQLAFSELDHFSGPATDPATGPSTAFLNFLRELSSMNWGSENRASPIQELDEDGTSARSKDHSEVSLPDDFSLSPGFNIPSFLEQIHNISHESPGRFNDIASSFNAAFARSPPPSPSVLPELDQSGFYLYNYYSNFLSRKVSIAPYSQDESNSFQRVFLPLAQKDNGVLFGILAWAGFHLGGKWIEVGTRYARMAMEHLEREIKFSAGANARTDRRSIIYKLAAILILCAAEICRGDVENWSIYLKWGWRLLKDNGGILNLNSNQEEHWLISNFAYHDLLASSTSDRGTYFPLDTYDEIFSDEEGISQGNLSPLLGVCKTLFKILGEISTLAYENKSFVSDYYGKRKVSVAGSSQASSANAGNTSDSASADERSDLSEHTEISQMFSAILARAHEVEMVVDNAKPAANDLVNLSGSELELQLTAFEAFQLCAKLYLRQAIYKINPSALECQILVNDLIKCIDVLIETPMQATLVFPIFMAGMFTVTKSGREAMRNRFEKLMKIYGPWNLVRVKFLVEKIWAENCEGDRVMDWHAMLNELGWEINFA